MPTYQYEREDGTVFEIQQRITEDAISVCPTTGQSCKRIIAPTAFHLKGGGWYKTDYGSSSSSTSSTKNATSSGSEGSSSSESKPKSETSSGESASAKKCSTGCGCH